MASLSSIGQIQISTTPAKLNINRVPEKQEIRQDHSALRLETTQARLDIQTTPPKLTIDQSQCFSEAGRKSNSELLAEMVSISQSAMYASIGRIAEQGTQMTNVHINPNAIADQAHYNAFEQFDRDWNIDFIPKSLPKIDVVDAKVDIQVIEGKVNNQTEKTRVEHNYTPAKFQNAMAHYGSISFSYEPKFNLTL